MASTRAGRATSLTGALSILTLPLWRRCLLTAGRTFSASSRGMLTRTVSPLASVLMTRTCSQRSLDEDVADWLELAEAEVDCAKAPRGLRTRAVAAMRAILAKRRLLRAHLTWLTLGAAGP